jgi:hypothetical protein
MEVDCLRERQEKSGSSNGVIMQTLNGLSSQMNSFQNCLDIRIDSLATTTSVDSVLQALQDMRWEAANDRNSQIDIIHQLIGTNMGRFNPETSQQLLNSIRLLDSKIEDYIDRSRTNTVQNTVLPSPVLKPFTPVDSGSLCHDQSILQRVEDQLATQARLLQLLTDRDRRHQSSGSWLDGNDDDFIQNIQETIRHSIQAILSLFRAGVNALLLRLWITLPVAQHIFRILQPPRLFASVTVSDSILFEDALGRITHLPYLYFRHHDVFMARLRCEFKNLPGERKVLLEQFRIFKQKRCNEFLTKDNWERDIRPGSKVAMSILLDSHGNKGDTCPRCETIKADMDVKALSQWYVSSLVSKLMLTARSNVCRLSWALQNFDPPASSIPGPRTIPDFTQKRPPRYVPQSHRNRLSGAYRIHEATSDPPLARDMLKTAKNESSSLSTSSPDYSEAALPLIDNEDIKSFKMVHIHSLNTISSIAQSLKGVYPFLELQPWQPSRFRKLTVESALMAAIQNPGLAGSGKYMWIHISSCNGSPQILNIGHTCNFKRRLEEMSRQCRVEYISDPPLNNESEMLVPFARQVETLICTELKNYRLSILCDGCGMVHSHRFYVSKEHAVKIVQKWKNWMLMDPYTQTWDGRWILKPSFLAHAREMCRPLAMNE